MNLNITKREGHFNLLDPREKSISVSMNIDREKYINLNFDIDEQMVDYIDDPHTWVDTAVQLIDRYNKCTISTTNEEAKKFKAFILEHQKELDVNRLKAVIEEKRNKMLNLSKEIGELEKDILELLQKDLTTSLMEAMRVDQ